MKKSWKQTPFEISLKHHKVSRSYQPLWQLDLQCWPNGPLTWRGTASRDRGGEQKRAAVPYSADEVACRYSEEPGFPSCSAAWSQENPYAGEPYSGCKESLESGTALITEGARYTMLLSTHKPLYLSSDGNLTMQCHNFISRTRDVKLLYTI